MDQPPPRVIAIYQQFARHRAVGKGLDPRVAVEPRIEHESRHQPLMRAAEIAHRGPDISGRSIDRNVLVNGSHGYVILVLEPVRSELPSFRGASVTSEPGIHNHDREYGFRTCAKWRIPE